MAEFLSDYTKSRQNQVNVRPKLITQIIKSKSAIKHGRRCQIFSTTTIIPFSLFIISLICVLIIEPKPATSDLNPVLDINETFPYLIDPKTGRQIAPKDYMDFENIYAPDEDYRRNITAPARNYHLIKAFDFANYFQSDYWRYSDPVELQQSAEPVANETLCRHQINWILKQLNGQRGEEILFDSGQQHVNLMTLLDSYGKPDAATFSGHNLWLGSYYECIHVRINTTLFGYEQCLQASKNQPTLNCTQELLDLEQKQIALLKYSDLSEGSISNKIISGRYCMGKARDKDWPQDDPYKPQITYKIGMCLPESCQTLSIKSLKTQFNALMQINLPSFWKTRLNLADIYCLPDERSPLRKLNSAGYILLSFIIIWITLVFVSTIIYACYKRNEKRLKKLLSMTSCIETLENQQLVVKPEITSNEPIDAIIAADTSLIKQQEASNHNRFVCRQNINNFTENLTTSGKKSTLSPLQQITRSISNISLNEWLKDSPTIIRILKCMSLVENMVEFREPPASLKDAGSAKRLRINLNALDCIKCICCIFVIFGHIVFIHMQHMTNITHTIELSNQATPRILISLFNFVDTFFIISGMLTAYFIFKRFNAKTFANPLIWIYISFMRLLRLSPVYILVFWFTKTLTIYIADGPLWDYATDKGSIKGLCRNDNWWKSLLYLGNWNSMQPLCVLPAWSIIVDSQYSLILPPIIFLLMKYRLSGYIMMLVAIIVSTIHMSWQLATQEAVKTSDMAKVRLHVYPLISRFAAEFYNTAFNRIGPVAIGIFGGHILYLYDIGKIRQWPAFMRGYGFKLILLMHLFILILPTLSRLSEDPAARDNGETDLTIFILSNAAIKPIWSIVNTILLLRLITDLRRRSIIAQLMSHNLWHCMGKLCFISYLIHYEIILVLLKSRQDGLVDPNWSNAGREFSYAFLLSTAMSYCIYILFEGPVNNLITMALRVKERVAEASQANKLHNANDDSEANGTDISDNNRNRTNGKQYEKIEAIRAKTDNKLPPRNDTNQRLGPDIPDNNRNIIDNQRNSANHMCQQIEMQRYEGA